MLSYVDALVQLCEVTLFMYFEMTLALMTAPSTCVRRTFDTVLTARKSDRSFPAVKPRTFLSLIRRHGPPLMAGRPLR